MNIPSRFFKSALPALLLAAVLSGCAAIGGYAPDTSTVGQPRAEVLQRLGAPTLEQPLPTGQRLVYARGPMGHHTYFVDLDAQGRVSGWQQVLTEANFQKVLPDMPAAQVLALIGPPSESKGLARQRGYFHSYRYENPQCLWFQVEYTAQNTVRSAGYGTPPECERNIDWLP